MGSFRNVRTSLSKLIDAIWFIHLFHLHLVDYLSMQTYMLIQEYSQAHKQGAGVCLVWAHTPWKGKFVKGNRNVAGIRKNKIMPSAATQTDLEMVTLSEVSQGRTDIWYSLYVESKKTVKQIYLQKRNRFTDFKSKLMVTRRERGGEG